MIPSIRISDYSYDLPDERIAKYPLPERDSSKLLRYKDGQVEDFIFRDLPGLLPEGEELRLSIGNPGRISRFSALSLYPLWSTTWLSPLLEGAPGNA